MYRFQSAFGSPVINSFTTSSRVCSLRHSRNDPAVTGSLHWPLPSGEASRINLTHTAKGTVMRLPWEVAEHTPTGASCERGSGVERREMGAAQPLLHLELSGEAMAQPMQHAMQGMHNGHQPPMMQQSGGPLTTAACTCSPPPVDAAGLHQ